MPFFVAAEQIIFPFLQSPKFPYDDIAATAICKKIKAACFVECFVFAHKKIRLIQNFSVFIEGKEILLVEDTLIYHFTNLFPINLYLYSVHSIQLSQ